MRDEILAALGAYNKKALFKDFSEHVVIVNAFSGVGFYRYQVPR